MDLVNFGLEITTGTRVGGNGRQREAMDFVTFGLPITIGSSSGGNRRQREAIFGNFRAANHHWDYLGRQWEATAPATDLGAGDPLTGLRKDI